MSNESHEPLQLLKIAFQVFKHKVFQFLYKWDTWDLSVENYVTVTSNSLAKGSLFRESYFALTQANYRKIQGTVKRNWNKRIFSIWNLQIPIHFLPSLLVSHENEMLVLWLPFNYISPQQNLQKLLFADVLLNGCS